MTNNATPALPAKTRLTHIDACRGLTMLLVVYFHITMTFGIYTDMIRLLSLVRMPMFLAISGFVAYAANYDSAKMRQRSLNRIIKQFYPTIWAWMLLSAVMSFQASGSMPSIISMIYDPHKSGLWFTFVLVYLFFIALPLLILFSRKEWGTGRITLILITVCIFFVLFEQIVLESIEQIRMGDLLLQGLNIEFLVHSAPFFFLGMIAKVHHQSLDKIGLKWSTLMIAILCFAIFSSIYFAYPEGWLHQLSRYLSAVPGMLVFYCIFLRLSRMTNWLIQKIMHWLTIVGKRTLEIYLLHGFFILCVQSIVLWVEIEDTWVELPVLVAITIGIAVGVLYILELFRCIGIYEFLFPQSTDRFLSMFEGWNLKTKSNGLMRLKKGFIKP